MTSSVVSTCDLPIEMGVAGLLTARSLFNVLPADRTKDMSFLNCMDGLGEKTRNWLDTQHAYHPLGHSTYPTRKSNRLGDLAAEF